MAKEDRTRFYILPRGPTVVHLCIAIFFVAMHQNRGYKSCT